MLSKLKHIYHLIKLVRHNRDVSICFLNKKDTKGNILHMNIDNTWLNQCTFTFEGKDNSIEIESGCQISGVWFFIKGNGNKITIGKDTYIYSSYNKPTMLSACNGTNIQIGDNCLFSNDIEIQTTDHHKLYCDNKRINEDKDIIIGNHCWICAHTSILKGAIIDDGCVIGAKSLVNKNYSGDKNSIIAGNPAKVIRQNINWEL